MRQLIIVRKDLNMSPGKLSAQVSHASMAFITNMIKSANFITDFKESNDFCIKELRISKDIYTEWFCDIYTKTICEAKNKDKLLKVLDTANELGLKENEDYFLIKDFCLTELTPEEVDESGRGKTLTCIGFRPLPDDIAHTLSKKYQLYK